MNTQQHIIDIKPTITVEQLNAVSLENVDSNTYGIYTTGDEFVCNVMWDSAKIWTQDSEYYLTADQAKTIISKVEDALFEQESETEEEYISYDEMYGVSNAMFI